MGKKWKQWQTLYFGGSKITSEGDCSHEIKTVASWKKSCDQPRQHIKKQRYHLAEKVCTVKAMIFPVVMYGCESWTVKKAECQRIVWTVVLEKTLENLLDSKKIKPVNPKGNQPWIFIGRTDAEAEAQILWLPDVKNWLLGKDPDAGKDWRQEEKKGITEEEMVAWHHRLYGPEFEQALGVGDGQGSLECCSPWGHKELTLVSDWNELMCVE